MDLEMRIIRDPVVEEKYPNVAVDSTEKSLKSLLERTVGGNFAFSIARRRPLEIGQSVAERKPVRIA